MNCRIKSTSMVIALMFCFVFTAAAVRAETKKHDLKVVKCCVINGMIRAKMWQEVSKMFEKKTGIKVEVISTGPKGIISKPFMRGEADLLTMHSSDGTTDLVVEGYGVNIRPWARNDLVILGPPADPAGIRGMKDGAAALKKIAETKSKILDTMGLGKREMSHKMWKKAGIRPRGDWVLKDEAPTRHLAPAYAAEKGAYLIYGRMPYMTKKIAFRDLEIMVTGDPEMRRPYMVMEANPVVFPQANHKGARLLSDYLLSEEVQTFLADFGKETNDGYPCFYPVWPYNQE